MKHKRLTALVLAAALVLAGCGGTKKQLRLRCRQPERSKHPDRSDA